VRDYFLFIIKEYDWIGNKRWYRIIIKRVPQLYKLEGSPIKDGGGIV
jgi:hypothetical protein